MSVSGGIICTTVRGYAHGLRIKALLQTMMIKTSHSFSEPEEQDVASENKSVTSPQLCLASGLKSNDTGPKRDVNCIPLLVILSCKIGTSSVFFVGFRSSPVCL
jgi:hypothetical protein